MFRIIRDLSFVIALILAYMLFLCLMQECGYGAQAFKFTVVNSGTNDLSFGAGATVNGCVGGSTLLVGTSSTHVSGVGSTPTSISLYWGGTGNPCASGFNLVMGTTDNSLGNTNDFGTFYIRSDGTNCNYSFTYANPNSTPATYSIQYFINGAFTSGGNVNLAPNATGIFSWYDPACGGGAYKITKLGVIDPGDAGGGINLPVNGTAGYGTGGNTTPPVNPDTPPPVYFPPTNGNIGTNGPIQFPTNGLGGLLGTNPVTGGTVITGDNAIYTAITKEDSDIVSAIRQLDTDVTNNATANANNVTNGLGHIHSDLTNFFNAWSNAVGTNTLGPATIMFSNAAVGFQSNGISVGTSGSNLFASSVPSTLTNNFLPSDAASDGGGFSFSIISAHDMSLNWSNVESGQGGDPFAPWRIVCAFLTYALLFMALYKAAFRCVVKIMTQRQILSIDQQAELLGSGGNTAIVSAIVYSAIIVALIGTVFAAVGTALTGGGNLVSTAFSTVDTSIFTTSPQWHWISHILPMHEIITCIITYIVYDYVLLMPMSIGVSSMIWFLVGT